MTNLQTYGAQASGPEPTGSGRGTVIAVNPVNPSEVFFGTANGGLWHSSNVARGPRINWEPITDGLDSLAIGSILLEDCSATPAGTCGPGTRGSCGCSKVWIGTGENGLRRDTYYGAGVYLLESRGHGEFPTFDFEPVSDSKTVLGHNAVNRIVRVDSSIWVSTSSNVTSSAVHSTTIAPAPVGGFGLYKSDSEGPWVHVAVSGGDPADATDLEALPGSPHTIFAGFVGKGLFRSTDAGSTWCALNPGSPTLCSGATGLPSATPLLSDGRTPFSTVEVATSEANPNVLVALFGQCDQPGPASVLHDHPRRASDGCSQIGGFFRSVDGGTTWSSLSFNLNPIDSDFRFSSLEGYPNYTHVLKEDPTDPYSFYYGGGIEWRCTGSAGSTSYSCTTLGTEWLHPDLHDIVFPIAGNNSVIYDAQDGGFAFSDDGGTHWNANSSSTGFEVGDFATFELNEAQFHTVATNPNSDIILGGLQDNGWAEFSGTRVWARYQPASGDGGGTLLDFVGPSDSGEPVAYLSTSRGGLSRISNSQHFEDITSFIGASAAEPVAFYPPIRLHPTTRDLYYATNRLFKSTDTDTPTGSDTFAARGDTWTAISPVLGDTTTDFEGIEEKNVVTSIGLSPSDSRRVYLGYYDGEVFASQASGPCPDASCWTKIGGPGIGNLTMPGAAVTSIAVDPTNPSSLYVAYSGFGLSSHVFKNDGAMANGWSTFSSGLPTSPDVPVNVIAIEPSQPTHVWLGADDGVWRTNGTSTWTHDSFNTTGLPHVPVYDLSLDEAHNRAVAATHGRGMWVLTAPAVTTKEGWVTMNGDTAIWDIPIYGYGFVNTTGGNVPCEVELIQASGNVCAKGKKDVTQGDIFIDGTGTLKTSIPTSFSGDSRPAVWGCLDSNCLPDSSGNAVAIDHCIHDASAHSDPVTDVKVVCDNGQVGFAHVNGAPFIQAPSSNIFKVDPPQSSGTFDVLISVEDAFGNTRVICSPTVPFSASDTDPAIEARIAAAIDADPLCKAATIQPHFIAPLTDRGEDEFSPSGVSVTGPGVSGAKLFVTLRLRPNNGAAGMCFTMSGLGDPFTHNLAIVRTAITTGPQGAAGEGITITETTNLGVCSRSILTTPGESADDIAEALRSAFHASGNPNDCPASENPVDVTREGSDLVTVLADTWTICSNDSQVGMAIGPEELDLAHLCAVPPTLTVPSPTTTSSCSTPSIGTATATSACGGPVAVTNNAPTTFPLGDTTVTWTARDSLGNVSTATQVVTAVLGDDVSCCPMGYNVIVGNSLPNILIGTNGPDCILGLGGNDQIFGNGGDDAISGGAGNDLISGGFGDDYVNGGDGIDHIHGDPGNDTLLGGAGNDDLDADDGDDLLNGGDGDDDLNGGNGNDVLHGGADDDHLNGFVGTDVEDGGPGADTCLRSLLFTDVISNCEVVIP